jgi:serine/threonine protein phosphatase PrpC
VKLLTIGAFARAARLSPKALRLYDELGLLKPVRVDEQSGYRYYSPEQLEAARMVAWLRRIGMPLAKIAEISGRRPDEVAAAVTAFLRVAEADFSERKGLALFLIDFLSGRETAAMPGTQPGTQLAISYAAASDIGRARDRNQDAAYAGPRLLAVADGMGPGGDVASETVIEALRPLEAAESPGDLLNALSDAVAAATSSLRDRTESDPEFADSGSTLTAMLLSGSRLALVHIGDTRAYLLRDGGLFQITHDHSVVQSLIDSGRLTQEEAASHPQRSLLLKALGAGDDAPAPDLSLRDAQAGDRYLLCSDGLTAVVPAAVIRRTLSEPGSAPQDVARRLIELANEAGGPDNIACVVADVTQAALHRRFLLLSGRRADPPGAPDAGGGRRPRGQPVRTDGLAAPDACAVRAAGQPCDRGVDPGDLLHGPGEQRGGVLPLERERRALRVVLVVGTRIARGLGDGRELPAQRGRPHLGTCPLRQQQLTGSGHRSDVTETAS